MRTQTRCGGPVRAESWHERVLMMQWWADKLDALPEGATVTLPRVAQD